MNHHDELLLHMQQKIAPVETPRSHAKFTGSTSTVSETSSGKDRVSSTFASDRLSLLICRVRSMS